MWSNRNKILTLLLVLLVAGLIFSGCTRSIGMAKGWAGGIVAGDTIFIGSMEGTLVALSISDGRQLGVPVSIGIESPSSGGLGCLPTTCAAGGGTTTVAIYGSPTMSETLVYVAGYDGGVYAFQFEDDRIRQEPKWYSRPNNISGPIVGGLVVAQEQVYYGTSDGDVFAVDAIDGHRKWLYQTPDRIWTTPSLNGDTLYIGCFDNNLYALDITDGTEKWRFSTEGAIMSTPLVDNGIVYLGSFDRHLYAIDADTGQEIWHYPVDDEAEGNPSNWFWAKPLIHNGVIYAPCLDGKVYCMNAESGRWVADFDLGSPISSSPALFNDLLIVATQDGTIYTINTINNKKDKLTILNENDKVYAPLFINDGNVYVHTSMDILYEIDVQSGASKKLTLTTSE